MNAAGPTPYGGPSLAGPRDPQRLQDQKRHDKVAGLGDRDCNAVERLPHRKTIGFAGVGDGCESCIEEHCNGSNRDRGEYEHGVSCHQCIEQTSQTDKNRFRERQKQILLSRARGEAHMTGFDGS